MQRRTRPSARQPNTFRPHAQQSLNMRSESERRGRVHIDLRATSEQQLNHARIARMMRRMRGIQSDTQPVLIHSMHEIRIPSDKISGLLFETVPCRRKQLHLQRQLLRPVAHGRVQGL